MLNAIEKKNPKDISLRLPNCHLFHPPQKEKRLSWVFMITILCLLYPHIVLKKYTDLENNIDIS